MLIKLHKLIRKYDLMISGVIHAGGHFGEEYEDYAATGIKHIHFFEPCKDSFQVMRNNLNDTGCFLYNVALGAHNKEAVLHREQHNKGQSNSILTPAKHLDYYPDIVFVGAEQIEVKMLDSFRITDCNLLVMDVQGYELEVMKGAHETLKHIDYIYTEVNREELYSGCAMVEELDDYLQDFERVETKWVENKGWGDGFYLKVKK